MNDIEKASAMIAPSAFYEINPENVSILANAFKAAIEQHEAFRQEVSDAVVSYFQPYDSPIGFQRFIIHEPKPDPLVEVLHEVDTGPEWDSPEDYCNKIRAALEARGLEIREKNDV